MPTPAKLPTETGSRVVKAIEALAVPEQETEHRRSQAERPDEEPWVSPATAKRLAGDASRIKVLESENGHVLNIGRRSRIVPDHIDRALNERDKSCCFPGCCESRYVNFQKFSRNRPAQHCRCWHQLATLKRCYKMAGR